MKKISTRIRIILVIFTLGLWGVIFAYNESKSINSLKEYGHVYYDKQFKLNDFIPLKFLKLGKSINFTMNKVDGHVINLLCRSPKFKLIDFSWQNSITYDMAKKICSQNPPNILYTGGRMTDEELTKLQKEFQTLIIQRGMTIN